VTLIQTPAILLRSYPYSETSQILRFYAESLGVVGAMAKGVRKAGGRGGGSLSTFTEGTLALHYRDHRELQTYRDFAATRPRPGIAGSPLKLAGASVLGELVLKHAESEANPALFLGLSGALDRVEAASEEGFLTKLLLEIWSLVRELGYEPMLDGCVECGRELGPQELGRFDFAAGGLRCASCAGETGGPRLGPVARTQLMGLLEGAVAGELRRPRAHLRLASDFVTYHISGGTPLRSMSVLGALMATSHA
jgi:DNA repair protein RecO (recombination protein O)